MIKRLLGPLIILFALLIPVPAVAQSNIVTLGSQVNSGTIPISPGTGTVQLGAGVTSPFSLLGAYGTITFTITGGWSGTIVPEVQSCDSAGTWTTLQVFPLNSTIGQSSITANGVYQGSGLGFCAARARGNTVATAAATVTLAATLISSAGAGGGGGGAVTIADGADVTLGAKADVAWVSGSGSLIAIAKTIATNTGAAIPDCGSLPCTNKIGVLAPLTASSTQTKVTITTANTYQQYLASNTARKGCTIQFITSAHTGFVFFGAAPADTTTSFQLSAGQSLNCNIGDGVLTDAIQLTSSNNSDVFVVNSW